jgi:hypothetical protein
VVGLTAAVAIGLAIGAAFATPHVVVPPPVVVMPPAWYAPPPAVYPP